MRVSTKTPRERAAARKRALYLILSGFFIILGAVMLMNLESPRGAARTSSSPSIYMSVASNAQPHGSSAAATMASSSPLVAKAPPVEATIITEADLGALTVKRLLIPVAGVSASQLRDSFYDARSEGRIHQALDIMAPFDTPVLAVDDGKIMRLHRSDRGGIMLYESDTSGLYVYYYGHLSRYADGIAEGKQVRRGEVIAYVGDTGNAGASNFHLHFGISKMSAPGKWSGGQPINPYPLLADKPTSSSIGSR